MTTFKQKLKSICNYSEENKPMTKIISHIYMDIVTTDDLVLKRNKRNILINEILDEVYEVKEDEYYDSNVEESYNSEIISPKLLSINMNACGYLNEQSIYDTVVNFLENNTKNKYNSTFNFDTVKTNDINYTLSENMEINYRRLITKINSASNYIAGNGRIGPATSVIVGKNNWEFFGHTISDSDTLLYNVSVILDDNISADKIIVCRASDKNSPGLSLINNIFSSDYYFKETDNWVRQYVWFDFK